MSTFESSDEERRGKTTKNQFESHARTALVVWYMWLKSFALCLPMTIWINPLSYPTQCCSCSVPASLSGRQGSLCTHCTLLASLGVSSVQQQGQGPESRPIRASRLGLTYTHRYTRLEILVWSHSVFWLFIFCRKRRFVEPLLLSSFVQLSKIQSVYLYNTPCPPFSKLSFVPPPAKILFHL